ncbi:MAG: DNA polymerase III subunit beta [Rikenellaceae bacterium]
MKFTISSSALLSVLSATGKVISNKNTFPILDYFLLDLKEGVLKITTSDLETTLITTLAVDNVEREGVVAAPGKLMLDSLKEFADMPLDIDVDDSTWEIKLCWRSGSLSIPGANPSSYPMMQQLAEEQKEMEFESSVIMGGISKTLFATADDELRPVMNGIFVNVTSGNITFVATDAHKLVKYSVDTDQDTTASFILPKKPANLLKSMLVKVDDLINIKFDSQNVLFTFGASTMVCRLIEGTYPNYNAVIPTQNPNKMLVDRVELLNSIRRVAVCSNPTTNLIRMDISANKLSLKAQDIDFSVSANETLSCSYESDEMTIGFKSTFLVEILNNTETPTVMVELADSTRAGVFKAVSDQKDNGESLMLLMPMMINM